MARPRIRPGDRLWTYQEIAELVKACKATVKDRVCRLKLPTYRKPQSNLRYLLQSDVERLMASWLIPVRQRRGYKRAQATETQQDRADSATRS